MTARDFTPTDEHMQNLAEDYAGVLGLRDDFRRGDERDAYLLVVDGLAASPAFQSIIAAAKAEARSEIADEIEKRDWTNFERGDWAYGADEAARQIVDYIREQNEATA